ncbi:MAG TPA: class I SAM-dependent methyltransferase [Dehalococcoidia bacterium]|nr:class I SAM-dependent methyltransferase [Dehalococcoidia bacterium]
MVKLNQRPRESTGGTPYEGAALRKRSAFILEQVSLYARRKQADQLRVLDLGCGIGGMALALGAQGYRVVGVDVDPETISFCNGRSTSPNVTFLVGDGEDLALGEEFDVVIASEVLEHIQHPDRLIGTMDRHLARGGIGILSVPNGYCLWELVVSRHLHRSRLVASLYRSRRAHKLLTGSDTPFYSMNAFCFHSHFFSFGGLRTLLARGAFQVALARHSDLGVMPEWSWLRILKRIECGLADFVPHALAGGWLLVVGRQGEM